MCARFGGHRGAVDVPLRRRRRADRRRARGERGGAGRTASLHGEPRDARRGGTKTRVRSAPGVLGVRAVGRRAAPRLGVADARVGRGAPRRDDRRDGRSFAPSIRSRRRLAVPGRFKDRGHARFGSIWRARVAEEATRARRLAPAGQRRRPSFAPRVSARPRRPSDSRPGRGVAAQVPATRTVAAVADARIRRAAHSFRIEGDARETRPRLGSIRGDAAQVTRGRGRCVSRAVDQPSVGSAVGSAAARAPWKPRVASTVLSVAGALRAGVGSPDLSQSSARRHHSRAASLGVYTRATAGLAALRCRHVVGVQRVEARTPGLRSSTLVGSNHGSVVGAAVERSNAVGSVAGRPRGCQGRAAPRERCHERGARSSARPSSPSRP